MADMDLWTEDCVLSNFADDTQSPCVADSQEKVREKTSKDATNIFNFFSANDLVNNRDKACVVYNSKGKGDQRKTLPGGERLVSHGENESASRSAYI